MAFEIEIWDIIDRVEVKACSTMIMPEALCLFMMQSKIIKGDSALQLNCWLIFSKTTPQGVYC